MRHPGKPQRGLTRRQALMAAIPALGGLAGGASAQPEVRRLRGAGSTFAAPLYIAMSEKLGRAGSFELDYASVGSGEGVRRIIERQVDFGATDRPMARRELEERGLLQLPTAIGGVVVTANLPGVPVGRLRLSSEVLADLFLGRIANWNDARLRALNPGIALPALAVSPLHREESSGTSYLFSNYLDRTSPAWKLSIGVKSQLVLPRGQAVRGNGGMARAVSQQPGALGYLEYSYAQDNGLPMMNLRNRFGEFVSPSAQSISAAVVAADWELLFLDPKPTFEIDTIDAAGPRCWPIVGMTYVVAPTSWADAGRAAAFVQFVEALYAEGGVAIKTGENYVPLPSRARNLARVTMRVHLNPARRIAR